MWICLSCVHVLEWDCNSNSLFPDRREASAFQISQSIFRWCLQVWAPSKAPHPDTPYTCMQVIKYDHWLSSSVCTFFSLPMKMRTEQSFIKQDVSKLFTFLCVGQWTLIKCLISAVFQLDPCCTRLWHSVFYRDLGKTRLCYMGLLVKKINFPG